jgi:hypothetical protein
MKSSHERQLASIGPGLIVINRARVPFPRALARLICELWTSEGRPHRAPATVPAIEIDATQRLVLI